MKQCPQCGSEMKDDDLFCPRCGAYSDSKPLSAAAAPKPQIKKPTANWGAILAVAILLTAVVFGAVFIFGGGVDFNKKATENIEISVDSITLMLDPDIDLDSPDQLYRFEDGYRICIEVTVDGKTVTWPTEYYRMEEAGVEYTPENNIIHVNGVGLNSDIVIFVYAKTDDDKVMNIIDVFDVTGQASGQVEKYGVSGVRFAKSEIGEDGKVELSGDTFPWAKVSLTFKYTPN